VLHILLTRPQQDACRTARALEALGHRVTTVPLFEIAYQDLGAVQVSDNTAFVFTSANGVRAWANAMQSGAFSAARIALILAAPCFVVGPQTGAAARDLGFVHVWAADNTGSDLIDLVCRQLDPARTAVLHVRGATVATDIVRALRAARFACRSVVAYRQEPRPAAADELEAVFTLSRHRPEAAAFFSPRTAQRFRSLIEERQISSPLRNVTALCFSQAVADNLNGLKFRSVRIARVPSQSALIDLIHALEV